MQESHVGADIALISVASALDYFLITLKDDSGGEVNKTSLGVRYPR